MKRLFVPLLLMIALQSCYYDNEEELYPGSTGCDTSNVSYSADVAGIMEINCNGCHGSGFHQGGVITDNYNDLKTIAENGRLWGAINHEDGYKPMPENSPKLPDCELSKIRSWIDAGYPQN